MEMGPIQEDRHPSSELFHQILDELGDLHDRKMADYGGDEDPFRNVKASALFGVSPWVGAMIRLNDKVNRLASYAVKGELSNEGAEDSFRDIAVYAVIALVLWLEEQEGDGEGNVEVSHDGPVEALQESVVPPLEKSIAYNRAVMRHNESKVSDWMHPDTWKWLYDPFHAQWYPARDAYGQVIKTHEWPTCLRDMEDDIDRMRVASTGEGKGVR